MDITGHKFVGTIEENPRAGFMQWMQSNVPSAQIIYRTADTRSKVDAISAGVGAGFDSTWHARRYPNFVQLCPPLEEWIAPIWLVTHVDLHRTAKVQSATAALKAAAKNWRNL